MNPFFDGMWIWKKEGLDLWTRETIVLPTWVWNKTTTETKNLEPLERVSYIIEEYATFSHYCTGPRQPRSLKFAPKQNPKQLVSSGETLILW